MNARDMSELIHQAASRFGSEERFAGIEEFVKWIGDGKLGVRGEYCYWKTLRKLWMGSDMIGMEDDYLVETAWYGFDQFSPHFRPLVMTTAERRALATLPATVTVYRGCIRELNERGWSWTLDRESAEHFAIMANGPRMALFGGSSGVPVVVMARMPRRLVLAYLTDRGEDEIVLNPAHVGGVRELRFDYARACARIEKAAETLEGRLADLPSLMANARGKGTKRAQCGKSPP